MPEFHLNFDGDHLACERFAGLDSFTQGYITALFFTAPDDSPEGNGDGNTMDNPSVADLSEPAWSAIVADCNRFQLDSVADMALILSGAESWNGRDSDESIEAAGRDFCYTRNGHGCGFWDGDWSDEFGDRLSGAAKRYHGQDLYRGDDGMLYVMSG